MNSWSKSLLFTMVLATIAIQSSEVDLKEDAANKQRKLDYELYSSVACGNINLAQQLLLQNANPKCDFPSIRRDVIYVWARRPLVRALWRLEKSIEDYQEDIHIEINQKMVELLLQHRADPNVTLSPTTNTRAIEHLIQFIYRNRNFLTFKLAPAYKTLELLLAHGATTDLDSWTFPHGIHGLAEDDSELKRILKEHAAKIKAAIAGATSLDPDTMGLVVKYLV